MPKIQRDLIDSCWANEILFRAIGSNMVQQQSAQSSIHESKDTRIRYIPSKR